MLNSLIDALWQHLQSRFHPENVTENGDHLVDLSPALQAQLTATINDLPSPAAYQSTIQAEVHTAINAWQSNLEAANSLVFLGSPVEAIADILHDSLPTDFDRSLKIITPLACQRRPPDPLMLTEQIQQGLGQHPQLDINQGQDPDHSPNLDSLKNRTTIMIIPCLDQLFLRCIGGWKGIEYLQKIVINHHHCFWVIGCNQWAWNFLDFVCQLSAYFSEVKRLPKLDGEMLEDWLDPIAETVNKMNPHQSNSVEKNNHRTSYWNALASQSAGISQIAVKLWLQSLRIDQSDEGDDSDHELSEQTLDEKKITLTQTRPSLPSLPSLTNVDRYLLYSLLIHGRMTSHHLAFSLGQSQNQIQTRIQWLLRQGLLERQGEMLSVQA
ncbi:MAG: helix-turn-helix domain-containing protein, partial [Synechocystis sp.]|nr:helix-turn-helix domain-containing protein [Synechocystis sp.]